MKSLRKILFPLVTVVLLFTQCKKNDHHAGGNDPVPPPFAEKGHTLISGIVIDEDNQPVPSVSIHINNQVFLTNDNGLFMLPEMQVGTGRTFIVCKKDGFFNSARGTRTVNGGMTQFTIRLIKKKNIKTFSAANGINTTIDHGAKVQIPAGSIVTDNGQAYTGTVTITTRYIDPEARNMSEFMPGGDFEAIASGNRPVELYSFGATEVILEGAAKQPLQLKTGTEATLTFPIAASQQAKAPGTLPLWYFDEQKGKWIEEGMATRQGNIYTGKVSHFSSWNVDKPQPLAVVYGNVANCDGSPARGIDVTIGVESAITDENGNYEVVVPAEEPMKGYADYYDQFGSAYQSADIPALAENERRKVSFLLDCVVSLEGTTFNCGGTAREPGLVMVKWSNGYSLGLTDGNGKFRLNVPGGKEVFISGAGKNGSVLTSIPMTTPASGKKTIDSLQLCNQPQQQDGEVSYTLDGAGYDNKLITIRTGYNVLPDAVYSKRRDETKLNKPDENGFGFGAYFEGTRTGTLDDAEVFLLYVKEFPNGEIDQVIFDPVDGQFSFTVTKYGAVGQKIEGTFSGRVRKVLPGGPTNEYLQVKNGKFSLRRSPDED
jgi:hypothetical protein